MTEAAENIARVARALQRLGLMDAVFVGDATVELHLTDSASLAPRVTLDINVVVDAPTRHRFSALEERRREADHQPDAHGPIGRWLIDGVPVDLTATDVELAPGLGRPSLEAEVGTMPLEARNFVGGAVRELLAEPDFAFVTNAHLPPDEASRGRSTYIPAALRRLAEAP